jgi:nicotinamidase-related amidase
MWIMRLSQVCGLILVFDTTARYAVELGYHTTLIKDAIAAYTWEEIKTIVEVNFPNYGHVLLSMKEFIDICS